MKREGEASALVKQKLIAQGVGDRDINDDESGMIGKGSKVRAKVCGGGCQQQCVYHC